MEKNSYPRLDSDQSYRKKILPYCRLQYGEVWQDPLKRHRVGCLDATQAKDMKRLMGTHKARLAIQDPPYNVVVGRKNTQNLSKTPIKEYLDFCRQWIQSSLNVLQKEAHFYIWLGADQNEGFQPLADFMILMREFSEVKARSFITMRNQRGYGTQKNWMAVRQELLYYIRGNPDFQVEYTDIPKILRGYYKEVNGKKTENLERSKSENIRASNVWVDIQQVFYRMEENVPGCYAQKPLKAIERILRTSSQPKDWVLDSFSHAGTTLMAAEKLKRRCCTMDLDPIFAEISIRRLEHYRETGKTGWQFQNPFPELEKKTKKVGKRKSPISARA